MIRLKKYKSKIDANLSGPKNPVKTKYYGHHGETRSRPIAQKSNGFLKWGDPQGGMMPNFFSR